MRPKLSLKTLYRSPVRTVLTFILLAAVTFALFSQVMEFTIAKREMNKAAERYEGIATAEISPQSREMVNAGTTPLYMFTDDRVGDEHLSKNMRTTIFGIDYESFTQEQISEISELDYVDYVDTRYMTAGFCKEYPRVDDGIYFYNHLNQCVIVATIVNIDDTLIVVDDLELLGGRPQYPVDKAAIRIFTEQMMAADTGIASFFWAEDVTRVTSLRNNDGKYTVPAIEETGVLEIGKRYAFILRYEDWYMDLRYPLEYHLTDPYIGSWCDGVWALDGAGENYLETEEFAPLKTYIQMIDMNLNALDVVYTKNTHSIRYFADDTIGISQGRGLTLEDTENQNNVCLVSHDFAHEHELELGDTITLELGNKLFEQYISNGAIAAAPEMISTETTEVTLEIVGIYKDSRSEKLQAGDPHWSYSSNTVFVPAHLLNVDETELENHTFAPGEVSVVVDNAWNIESFAEDILPKLEELGYTVVFDNDNWPEMVKGYEENERLSLIKLSVLAAAVLMATVFVAFLYIVGKRKDYAIMRVLGTSKGKSGGALLLPLFVLAAVAAVVGAMTAYVYTQSTIDTSDALAAVASFDPTLVLDMSIPKWLVAVCIAGEIILALFIAAVMLGVLGLNSPLALIQNSTAKRKKIKKKFAEEANQPVVLGEWVSLGKAEHDGKKRKLSFSARYIFRHIRRTMGKVALLILVTAMLISVVGQLSIMNNSYHEIIENTDIPINFAGHTNLNTYLKLQNSEYIKDGYYCSDKFLEINGESSVFVITNNPAKYRGKDIGITFADGYDMSIFDEPCYVVLLGADLMEYMSETYGTELGGTVYLSKNGVLSNIEWKYEKNYEGEFGCPYIQFSDEWYVWQAETHEYYADEIKREFLNETTKFVVGGVITENAGVLSGAVVLPGSMDLNPYFGRICTLEVTEAYLKDNWRDEEMREFGEALAAENGTGEIAFIMDTSKLENVKNNVKLMETLYPIIVAAILVIGAFLCGLLIVQTSKDIAIMRVLGTSKRRVRLIMIVEHAAMCLVGIVVAIAVLVIRKAANAVIADVLFVCGLYFAAVLAACIVASIAASRKNVLELLQTKE